ncbi:MAG: hypothetical protein K5829_08675 [Treponema sp.]|nr:hypothetical protein [Treponema sp.]
MKKMNTNVALKNTKKREFIENHLDWNYFVNEVSKVFKLSKKEREEFGNSATAKIIATIPFEANCNTPERTAIANLSLYMVEKRGFQKYCAHLKEDDCELMKRLEFISSFDGGNRFIIEHGMYILALIMLEGYNQSAVKDKINNIYNPIASGAWKYTKMKNLITEKLSKTQNKVLDDLANELYATGGSW